jgi:hypothetical protein
MPNMRNKPTANTELVSNKSKWIRESNMQKILKQLIQTTLRCRE